MYAIYADKTSLYLYAIAHRKKKKKIPMNAKSNVAPLNRYKSETGRLQAVGWQCGAAQKKKSRA